MTLCQCFMNRFPFIIYGILEYRLKQSFLHRPPFQLILHFRNFLARHRHVLVIELFLEFLVSFFIFVKNIEFSSHRLIHEVPSNKVVFLFVSDLLFIVQRQIRSPVQPVYLTQLPSLYGQLMEDLWRRTRNAGVFILIALFALCLTSILLQRVVIQFPSLLILLAFSRLNCVLVRFLQSFLGIYL